MRDREGIEVIVRGLLSDSGKILVCRNLRAGYCFLPGGHVEFGESASKALRREFEEETGQRVKVGECCLVAEGEFTEGNKRHHEINVVFHVKLDVPALTPITSRESKIGFEWIDGASLSRTDFRPRAVLEWVERRIQRDPSQSSPEWASDMGVP